MSLSRPYNVLFVYSQNERNKELIEILKEEDFYITTCKNSDEAIIVLKSNTQIDLIIADVELDGMDGIELCTLLRQELSLSEVAIVFISERVEDYTQIAALEAGADDFLPIGLRPRLLKSKIRALLNRKKECCVNEKGSASKKHENYLIIDKYHFSVHRDQNEHILPKKEFELLVYLASFQGTVASRNEILNSVWQNKNDIGDRTIDVHIRKIREKLGESIIRTVKGVGYSLNTKAIIR